MKFYRIKINNLTYNLSPTLEGSAIPTRDAVSGTYILAIVCTFRTYKIKINGFYGSKSSFFSPVLADVFISENYLSLEFPDKLYLNLSFFGVSLTNELSFIEILESCE